MEKGVSTDMAAHWGRKLRKHSGSILTVTLIGALLCFAMAHLFLLATDDEDDLDRRRRDQLMRGRQTHSSRKSNPEDIESRHFSDFFGSRDASGSGSSSESGNSQESASTYISKNKYFTPGIRVVHLDLKGAAPNLSFLRELFSLISQAGGNGLLIEYEDMFPYWGPMANASALNAFTTEEINQLLQMAEENGLEVIPLVQTFGHMEHVLKLAEFSHLREMAPFPQSICPSQQDSFSIIRTMLDQVLQLHPKIKYFHIGCDEVYQLGQCSKCKDRMRKGSSYSIYNNRRRKNITMTDMQRMQEQQQQQQQQQQPPTPRGIFLDHVKRVAGYVKDNYNVQPIIWDDMLRSMSVKDLLASGIAYNGLVEPMVWVYVEDIDHFVDGDTWRTYSAVFPHLWTASAFKGAFGERLFMPNLHRHYRNHLSWLEVMARESGPFGHGRPTKFRGMALTGWSRYDHFAVLCELLPVAVPSLVLNLVTVSSAANLSEAERFRKVEKLLQCFAPTTTAVVGQKSSNTSLVRLSPLTLEQDPHLFELRRCRFPGHLAFGVVGTLHHFKGEVEALDTNSRETQGWLTAYNIRHNYSSPWRLTEAVGTHAYLIKALKEYARTTTKALQPIFDNATVEEWVEQNIGPLQEKTERLLHVVSTLTARTVWPRRPIP